MEEQMQRNGFEERMLLAFAATDAGHALEKGEIACYDVLSYDYMEDTGVWMRILQECRKIGHLRA